MDHLDVKFDYLNAHLTKLEILNLKFQGVCKHLNQGCGSGSFELLSLPPFVIRLPPLSLPPLNDIIFAFTFES